jgi:hypothetical protein
MWNITTQLVMLQARPKALKPARLSFVKPSRARLLGTALEAQGSA